MSNGPADQDLAALGRALGQFERRLDEVDSLVRMVAVGAEHELDEVKDQLAALRVEVHQEPDPGPDPGPGGVGPPPPHSWKDVATEQDWQDLAVWVDWLVATYELQPSRTVLPCWPAHPGVVEELAGLRAAWREAVDRGRSDRPNDAMIFWHDRWLHPCVNRLRDGSLIKLCADGHVPSRPARTVDRDLLAAAQAQAPGSAPSVRP